MQSLYRLICIVLIPLFVAVLLPAAPARADTWAVYWYVCGSDLERRFGGATADIVEALKAELNDDVKVVLQTGGTTKWQNEFISNQKLERFVIDKEDINRVESLSQASMGDSATLASFLKFCRDNHKADHALLIIWDHGGGSAFQLANDENFDNDGLTLRELRRALEAVWKPDPQHPPLEIIGFDACLMATLDVANVAQGFARYMVASEDVEPGNGWEYTGFLTALAGKTSMNGAELGRHICDTYMDGCKEEETNGGATLSVTDLSLLPRLNAAWNGLGLEAAMTAGGDSGFFAVLGRQANASENYANTKGKGFSNMVDMGGYVRRLQSHLPHCAGEVLEALEAAVIYKVNGPYRKSTGLSFYYPLDGGKSYNQMLDCGNVTSFLLLQGLQLGRLDEDAARRKMQAIADELVEAGGGWGGGGQAPVPPQPGTTPGTGTAEGQGTGGGLEHVFAQGASAALSALKPLGQLDVSTLEDAPIAISDDGDATLALGPEKIKFLSSVYCCLAYYNEEDDIIVILGKDADLHADWEQGVFRDNFRNTWAALDGHLIQLEVTQIEDDFYRYAVPVKLNGERVNLDVIYDFDAKAYRLMGARKPSDNGMVDKFLYKLKSGDEITTIFTAMTISAEEDDSEEVEVDTFRFTATSGIEDEDMGDGTYAYMFEMNDVQGNSALSQVASIEVKDGKIFMSKMDDE
ncbi:MAG: hypothetical protein J6N67_02745 [Desulfovibrio sp.]|nr:hypothetical protein [Desulfovibrio sp.]